MLDTAVLEGDVAEQRRRQAEKGAALHLRHHRVRIDGNAAVHHASDLVHLHRTAGIHADLGHLRRVGAEAVGQRQATTMPGWQRRIPGGFLP
ncbi:hypothetical protein D9M73_233050 [compost metagenome]